MERPEKKNLGAQTVICLSHRGSYDEIGNVYHELGSWAAANNVELKGKGFTVFLSQPNEFDWSSADYEVCIPVAQGTSGDERVTVKNMPECTVASVKVTGPYSKIPGHYTEILAWLDSEGWEIDGAPREVYLERQGEGSSYVTEIQFPVKSCPGFDIDRRKKCQFLLLTNEEHASFYKTQKNC